MVSQSISKNLLLAVFACLLALFPATAEAQHEPRLVQAGKQHLLEGEYEQAILLFSEQLRMHGFNKEAYYWRAHCLILTNRQEDAITDLKLILQYHSDDFRAMDALGYAYNQTGKYLEAIKWFNKAITYDDKNALTYNNRGMSYYYLGKFPTAFYDFNKAIHLDSTFAEAYSNRGSTRYNNQNIAAATSVDLEKAEADFTEALKLDNALLSAYRNRGIIRIYMKKYPEAYLDLQKAMYLDPEDPLIYSHMAKLMLEKEEFAEVVHYCGESLKKKPHQTDVLYLRARAYEALGQYDMARTDYEYIVQLDGNEHGKSCYHIGRTYSYESDPEQVYYWLNQARKHDYFKTPEHRMEATTDSLLKSYWEREDFSKLKEKIF